MITMMKMMMMMMIIIIIIIIIIIPGISSWQAHTNTHIHTHMAIELVQETGKRYFQSLVGLED